MDVPMSVRRAIVAIESNESVNVTAFCAKHQISRDTFYRIQRDAKTQGKQAALEPGSRAPLNVANKTPAAVEDRIIQLRKELEDFGADAGPASIWDRLNNEVTDPPSESTIWRILTRRGFITPDPSKAPGRVLRRFVAERANECWQIDDTPWMMSNGEEVKIIDIIDDHSRVCVESVAVVSCTGTEAFRAFTQAGQQWGFPERFLSDNAPEFKQTLANFVAVLGIAATHSRPYHPQTCGKVERFHQTLKKFLAKRSANSISELQAHLDDFQAFYNHERPHRSLGRRQPAAVFAAAPKSGPADRPVDQPTPETVVWAPTVIAGVVNIPGNRRVTVGAAFNGATATCVVTNNQAHIFIDGKLQRELTIVEGKKRYPLHNRPGRPT